MASLSLVALSVGFPSLVERPTGKDKSRPFPCQDRPCGCQSADQCFASCCCFTAAERVAFATAHRVEVPAALLAAASREEQARSEPVKRASCCSAANHAPRTHAADAISHESEPAAGDDHEVCALGHCDSALPAHDHADHLSRHGAREVKFVIGSLAAKCRGLDWLFTTAGAAMPTVPTLQYAFDWRPTGWVNIDSPRVFSHLSRPPLRPPCA